MRYKVGDKVRVRQWDDMVKEFGSDEAGRINKKNRVSFYERNEKVLRWCL